MRYKLMMQVLGILLIGSGVFLPIANAAPGDLDTTFAGTGFVREASSLGSSDSINATAVQPDGKIVSVGKVDYGGLVSCGIVRHNADGLLDASFDGDGRTLVKIGIEFNCNDVAVQNDGKIVVVGYVRFESIYNFAVFRYNADGSPDTSFDGDGRKISAFNNGDFANAVAIQADGKIVVSGNIGDDFAVVRYNGDGSFDTTFDGDGLVTTDFFGGPDHSRAIAIQTDGKILVAGNGRTLGGSFNDFAVARYHPNGSLDATFDGDGKVLTDIAGNNDNVQEVAVHTDGKIVVGGVAWVFATNTVTNNRFGLARYNADGSLDTTFDGDGKAILTYGAINELYDLVIQPDGKIVAAGGVYQPLVGSSFLLARFNMNGSLDTTFDNDGLVQAGFNAYTAANAVALQTDGKIIAAGYNNLEPNSDFLLMRFNPDGSLDSSFDSDGKSIANIYNWEINASTVAIQPDGKIVAAGKRLTSGSYPFAIPDCFVYRYNTDGTLDTSFDGDGRRLAGSGNCQAIAIQPDGKIIFAAQGLGQASFVMHRFNANGSPDSSFDSDGVLVETDNNSSNYPVVYTVAIQSDGKILAAGNSGPSGPGRDSTIYRYNPNGSRDTSFDGDGKVFTNFGGEDAISSIAIQTDGKIVVAGKAQIGSSYDFTVMRYNSDGSLDTSFDGDGIATIDFVGGYDYVNALAIQADGKILVVGAGSSDQSMETSTSDSALARLNTNGSLDTSFDGDGKIRAAISNYFDAATGVSIQTDGKILTSGSAMSITNGDLGTLENDFALVRYNSDGSPDTTYGTGGKAITDLFTNDLANAVALDSSGRVVIAGESDGQFTVARILGGSASPNVISPFDFDGDGKSDISIFRPSNGQWWYQRSSDNQVSALQFGAASDRLVPADYTGDGKTDVAVFRPSSGEWFILRSENNSFYSVPFGASGDLPAPADFDADGKADLTVFRPSSGTWFIQKSTGGTDIINFGQNGDVPTVADFDGDGKADVAIFRPSNGNWWLNRSTAGVFTTTFGTATDKPVAGNYTDDGKADIAFWRPSTGEWFVLRSENNSFYSVFFGMNGDIPTPGDYDGDGKFDTAVFRPSNQNWYVNRSNAGLLIQQFGLANDKPVPSAFVP